MWTTQNHQQLNRGKYTQFRKSCRVLKLHHRPHRCSNSSISMDRLVTGLALQMVILEGIEEIANTAPPQTNGHRPPQHRAATLQEDLARAETKKRKKDAMAV